MKLTQEDIFRQFHACFFSKYFSIQPEQVPGKSVQFNLGYRAGVHSESICNQVTLLMMCLVLIKDQMCIIDIVIP